MVRTSGVAYEQAPGAPQAQEKGRTGAGHAVAQPPRLPRQRRRSMLALAVLLIGMGALLSTFVVTSLSQRVSVVVLVRDVPVGIALTRSDVGTAMVSVDRNVQTVPGAQAQEVVGKLAATDLKRGALLIAAHLTATTSPGPGQQVVPVALLPSQVPARGLQPGDHVLAVITQGTQQQGTVPAPSSTEAGAGGRSQQAEIQATVDRVGQPDADGRIVVDLLLAAQIGPFVARHAVAGRVAVVLTPRRA